MSSIEYRIELISDFERSKSFASSEAVLATLDACKFIMISSFIVMAILLFYSHMVLSSLSERILKVGLLFLCRVNQQVQYYKIYLKKLYVGVMNFSFSRSCIDFP